MIVVLQVVAPAASPHKFVLRTGQRAIVGSTNHADFCLPLDGKINAKHFSISCTSSDCNLTNLGRSRTLVNRQLVSQKKLCNGDTIQAGDTLFSVSIQGAAQPLSATEPTVAEPDVSEEPEMSLVEICQYLDLADDVVSLAQLTPSIDELIDSCSDSGHELAGLRLRAHSLGNRAAVWWACLTIEAFASELLLTQLQQSAVAAAKTWVLQQTEATRQQSQTAALATGTKGIGGTTAWAAFCSGGNVGHPDGEPLEPNERMCGQLISGVQLLLVYHHAKGAKQRFAEIIRVGKQLSAGDLKIPCDDPRDDPRGGQC